MENGGKKYSEQVSVRWYGYIVLVLTILFFSGVFSSAEGPIKALDFTNISGSFGSLGEIAEDAGTLAARLQRNWRKRRERCMAFCPDAYPGSHAGPWSCKGSGASGWPAGSAKTADAASYAAFGNPGNLRTDPDRQPSIHRCGSIDDGRAGPGRDDR